MLKSVEWGEFRIGDLFDINPTKYYKLKKMSYHIFKMGKVYI